MAFYEREYFSGEPEFFLCAPREEVKKRIIDRFIDLVIANPHFDEGFKRAVRDRANIKLATDWGYVADIKYSRIDFDVFYGFTVVTTTGYSGTVESDHVSVSKNYSSSDAESVLKDLSIYRYLMHTDFIEKDFDTLSRSKTHSFFAKRKRIDDIPEYIQGMPDFKSNKFFEKTYYCSDTSDADRELASGLLSGSRYKGKKFSGGSVESEEITFIPYYNLTVEYQGEIYGAYNLFDENDIKDNDSIGKLSAEHIKEVQTNALIDRIFNIFWGAAVAVCVILFVLLCIGAEQISKEVARQNPIILFIDLNNLGPILFFASIAVCFMTFVIKKQGNKPKAKIKYGIISTIINLVYIVFFFAMYMEMRSFI